VRITVRVVQARPAERQVWAQSFQRDASGVLGLQGEVARAIAEQIQVDVTPDELGRLRRSRQINPAAYQAWLRAWATMNGSTNFDAERCIAHGEEAATTDSTYAPAYALTALCYDILPYQTQTPPRAAFPKARAAALRAIRLDPSLGSAYVALGLSLWLYDWDWVGADRAFRRAIELAPSEGQSHWWYGFYLATMGRHTEAVEQARQAELLSPGDPGPRRNLAMVLYLARRYDEAIDQAQRTIELAPQVGQNYDRLAHAYEAKGMYEAAANAWTKAVSLSNPGDMYRRGFRARSLALAGHRDQARATLTELLRQRQARYVSPTAIAHIYLGLGELDEAISWLEQAYEMHDPDMSLLKTWPVLDPLRSNPRFQRLLNRMNFPPSSG
jgi:tetratricopeptide (TPR) repeat protein